MQMRIVILLLVPLALAVQSRAQEVVELKIPQV